MENLYQTEKIVEKVVLVYVSTGTDFITPDESLQELGELAKTSGAEVVGQLVQNREKFHPKHYIGKGKLNELIDLVSLVGATAIICDDELSSVQLKNLEDILGIKVLDRTLLILDIFAGRANSAEGKVQVELAQLKYRKAHLIGIGKSLSKQGGGIGTRGPGEKKLETDRRHIEDRIVELNRELKEIEVHRGLLRKNNKNQIPVVSMVGYTNAGKSTLLNVLTDANVLAEDKLFATLDTTTRKVILPNGSKIYYVDTVGFIQKLPHTLINAFKATLEELKYADIIIHVIDASSGIREQQMEVVYETLKTLEIEDKPIITVFNKIDKEVDTPLPSDMYAAEVCSISAVHGLGIENFKSLLEKVLKSFRNSIKVIIPYNEGNLLGMIHENCEILEEEFREKGTFVEFFGNEEHINRVKKYEVE